MPLLASISQICFQPLPGNASGDASFSLDDLVSIFTCVSGRQPRPAIRNRTARRLPTALPSSLASRLRVQPAGWRTTKHCFVQLRQSFFQCDCTFRRGQFHFERGDLPPQFVGRDVSARSRFASLSQPRPAVDQLCLEHSSLRLDGLQLLDLLRLVCPTSYAAARTRARDRILRTSDRRSFHTALFLEFKYTLSHADRACPSRL